MSFNYNLNPDLKDLKREYTLTEKEMNQIRIDIKHDTSNILKYNREQLEYAYELLNLEINIGQRCYQEIRSVTPRVLIGDQVRDTIDCDYDYIASYINVKHGVLRLLHHGFYGSKQFPVATFAGLFSKSQYATAYDIDTTLLEGAPYIDSDKAFNWNITTTTKTINYY